MRIKLRFLLFGFFASCFIVAYGQSVTVLDEEEQPLIGVQLSTINPDYNIGVVTDENGQADVTQILNIDTILKITYLGYASREITISDLHASDFIIQLEPENYLFEEVIVFGRREVLQEEIPFQIATIQADEIASTHAQTSADALGQHSGVFIQKSQMGGGSPVIRGFEANRVLLVVDGIRMNNAIYRNGHLQNAITVDASILERMDVIFGPNSLMYGSDALGGVVHFRTKQPTLSIDENVKFTGQYFGRYASANHEKTAHFDFNLGTKRFASLTSVTATDYDDLRSGNNRSDRFREFGLRTIYQGLSSSGEDIEIINADPNVQVGTAYRQIDVAQKFLFTPNKYQRWTANFQFSTSSDVPRYDNLNEIRNGTLRWAEWNYGPQTRFLSSIEYRNLKQQKWKDQLIVIAAYQRIDEDRISRPWQYPLRNFQEEDVSVWSLSVDASKALGSHQLIHLDYGADIQYNTIASQAREEDIRTGAVDLQVLSRYASDFNHYTGLGSFISLNGKNLNETLRYQLGLRLSHFNYSVAYDRDDPINWPADFYEGISGNNAAFTWSAGLTYNLASNFRMRGIVSTAFRAPNIDDLAKIRINSDEITFPNINLEPEKSLNFEIGIDKSWDKVKLGTTFFYTDLDDAIVRRTGTGPSGETFWIAQGDTLNIVRNQNASSAYIYGVNLHASYQNSYGWHGDISFNYTRGRENVPGGNLPLAHIPPIYGKATLGLKNEKYNSKLVLRYNGSKPLSEYGGSVDNPDLATPDGALAWTTINWYNRYQLNDKLNISLAIENIADLHYRPFGSGVSAAGRNVIISVRGRM